MRKVGKTQCDAGAALLRQVPCLQPAATVFSSLYSLSREADKHILKRNIANNDVCAEVTARFNRSFPRQEKLPGNIVPAKTFNSEFTDLFLQRGWPVHRNDLTRAHYGDPITKRISLLDIVRRQQDRNAISFK